MFKGGRCEICVCVLGGLPAEDLTVMRRVMRRFHVFLTTVPRRPPEWRRVNVVELVEGATYLPRSIRSPMVEQLLLRSEPLQISMGSEAFVMFDRAERVIEKLDNMTLSLQVADLEGGVKELFDYLWNNELNMELELNHEHQSAEASRS